MLKLVIALNIFLPIIYGLTTVLYGRYFINKKLKTAKWASFLLLCGTCLHLVFLVAKGWHFQRFPIESSFESLSMLAFDIAVIYCVTERLKREYTTGIFFLSIVTLCQTVSTLLFRGEKTTNELLANPLFGVHASFTLLGLSALAIATLYALMYCVLAKQIKKKQFGILYEGLPDLETLDSMRQNATICGIIVLGIGILLGHFWAYKLFGHFGLADPKVWITDIALCAYATIWWSTWKSGVHGLRTNILSVWLFVMLFTVVTVLEFFLNTFHRFV
ncbi:inner membrane protein YpjD [Candidatus Uabimicrobium sp. HlEnr_7]|uniref:cytochrome C assembly family protein n=1 Tax=Candidatus Uabimicrobium helgolandensis TaxID=3095367 RepID=UPI003557FD0E